MTADEMSKGCVSLTYLLYFLFSFLKLKMWYVKMVFKNSKTEKGHTLKTCSPSHPRPPVTFHKDSPVIVFYASSQKCCLLFFLIKKSGHTVYCIFFFTKKRYLWDHSVAAHLNLWLSVLNCVVSLVCSCV